MTEENKKIIIRNYLIKLEKNQVRIIINTIDDFSDHPIRPWVKIFYTIKTKNSPKVNKVWSEYGTFNSLFFSEIRDQKLNELGI